MSMDLCVAIALLSRCPLLQGLESTRLTQIAEQLQIRSFRKNEVVLKENDPADALCLLLVGKLKVVSFTASGKEVGLSVIEPVSHFGEMGLIDNQPRSAYVVATTKSQVAFLPNTAALNTVFQDPTISIRLMRDLVQMLRNTNQQLLLLSYQHAQTRIAALLLDTLQVYQRTGMEAHDPLSQQDIANMTNTSRETVSRVLNQFSEAGILKRDGKRLFISDVNRLRNVVIERNS